MLLLQRLLTVMCSALATTGVETSVGVALVSFVFLLLQMLARPYRLSWVNALQTCSNICLVTLAILNSASGAFLSTGFDPRTDGDATLRHFQTTLEVLMMLALFPPPLVWVATRMNDLWDEQKAHVSALTKNVVFVTKPSLDSLRQSASEATGRVADTITLICGDGIHPNDVGYDAWARHIADACVPSLRRALAEGESP